MSYINSANKQEETQFTKYKTFVLITNQNKALNAVRRRHGLAGKSDRAGTKSPQCQTSPSLPAIISGIN